MSLAADTIDRLILEAEVRLQILRELRSTLDVEEAVAAPEPQYDSDALFLACRLNNALMAESGPGMTFQEIQALVSWHTGKLARALKSPLFSHTGSHYRLSPEGIAMADRT